MNSIPFLQYDFLSENNEIVTLQFTDPVRIISIDCIKDVIPALEQVQAASRDGYYCAGYISYEASPAFDKNFIVKGNSALPLVWFGIFDKNNVFKSKDKNVSSHNSTKDYTWEASLNKKEYIKGIDHIKNEIAEGNSYQVNFTMQIQSQFSDDDYKFYLKLKDSQQSSYCAYLNIGQYRILSMSPELFFQWDGQKIVTKPMKGTMKRGRWVEEDYQNYLNLESSEKNKAENVMIVDLLRNDLSKIAKTGSVKVPTLFEIEQYPTVFQMTSTVSAETIFGLDLVDIFTALFPCGSITGAPKVSTMKIISDIENLPRGVYCGAIGLIEPFNKRAIFNVAIRTLIIDANTQNASYGIGGGITWDSSAEEEYEEAITKSSILTRDIFNFELVEIIRLEDGEFFLLDAHLERLHSSATYFSFNKLDTQELKKKLLLIASRNFKGTYRVKISVVREGVYNITTEMYVDVHKESNKVTLALRNVNSGNVFLYHKTTNRIHYDSLTAELHTPPVDVLLWNENGELTEFTKGNLVLELDGNLLTPPIKCGLLPGTFRSKLLKDGKIEEKTLLKEDVFKSNNIWLINSVRKWVLVELY